MDSKIRLHCLGDFGAPIPPYVVLGDFRPTTDSDSSAETLPINNDDVKKFESAHGLVMIILVNNFIGVEENEKALAWEAEFIRFMRSFRNPNYTVSFMAERSLQDEIVRQSSSDALTVVMSYVFMFIYVAFALGQYQVK